MTPDAEQAADLSVSSEAVAERAPLAPIAQAWRIFGLASLTGRHRALLERAKQRPLSAFEKAEARQVATALEELQTLDRRPA